MNIVAKLLHTTTEKIIFLCTTSRDNVIINKVPGFSGLFFVYF